METLIKIQDQLDKIEAMLQSYKTVLNMDDVATLTGLSKSHLYKLTSANRIPHYKQSKHVFFDRQEIELWLKANPIKTAEQIDRESTSYVMKNRKGGAQ